jgi:hypothetical protein
MHIVTSQFFLSINIITQLNAGDYVSVRFINNGLLAIPLTTGAESDALITIEQIL